MKISVLATVVGLLGSFGTVMGQANIVEGVAQFVNNTSPKGYKLSTLVSVASGYKSVVDVLTSPGPLTLFAPTDDAFAKIAADPALAPALNDKDLVEAILTYHVLPGVEFVPGAAGRQIVNTALTKTGPGLNQLNNTKGQALVVDVVAGHPATVTLGFGLGKANVIDTIDVGNGIVHVIDSVLIPPQSASKTAVAAGLTSLAEALTNAGLVPTVDSLQGITVFAPTNDAFANLLKALGGSLPPLNVLQAVLAYHVVPSVAYSTDLFPAAGTNVTVPTVLGQDLTVIVKRDSIELAGPGNTVAVKVIQPDVLIDSGVVHVIDAVLLPDLAKVPSEPIVKPADAAQPTTTTSGPTRASPTSTPAPTGNSANAQGSNTSGAASNTASFAMVLVASVAVFFSMM
ncbi:Stabilin-2 [Quaeritorhiza haematococci]|nr:Stabilin-2 [Quaeritorhiza haematococci]